MPSQLIVPTAHFFMTLPNTSYELRKQKQIQTFIKVDVDEKMKNSVNVNNLLIL